MMTTNERVKNLQDSCLAGSPLCGGHANYINMCALLELPHCQMQLVLTRHDWTTNIV